MTIVNDPVYLTEPFVRTTDYELNVHQHVPPYPCGVVQEIDRAKGAGSALPAGHQPVHRRSSRSRHKIPVDATRGGAETMYPDFRQDALDAAAAGADPPRSATSDASRLRLSEVKQDTAHDETRARCAAAAVLAMTAAGRRSSRRRPSCRSCRCAATSTCSPAPAATSRCRSGKDGVLMVDAGLAQNDRPGARGDPAAAAARGRSPRRARVAGAEFGAETRSTVLPDRDPNAPAKPIRYIVNTHVASRSRRRQREGPHGRPDVHRRQRRRQYRRRRRRRRDPRARERAAADDDAAGRAAGDAVRRAADRHLLHRRA